ncbi:rhomboid family intramembrane serine protease [Pedobacter sp. Du54]|uniref:rhomboid family intramembrane serine protease n=1 Tax=Pedobacter anseongensis TaxID=3133439 RepID=UPI00309A7E9E
MMQYLNETPVASIIFIFTIISSIYAFNDPQLSSKFMLHPYSIAKGKKWYTFITSGLIHADWMHLFFNMFTYFAFAFQLEILIGHWQFGLLYFASMVLADITSVSKHKNHFWYHSLGASGAVSGVLFSYILFFPLNKIMILPIPFGIPSILFGVLYLVYCYYMSKQAKDNINHDAHFFGALTGMVFTLVLVPGIIPHFLKQLGVGG